MRVLLDTSVLIWWADDDSRLGPEAVELIEYPGTDAFVSAVSGWEISIKQAIGKFRAEGDPALWCEQGLFLDLPLTMDHGLRAGSLPLHHRDPFDRMLVAQAMVEGLSLVTTDAALRAYDVPVIDARA